MPNSIQRTPAALPVAVPYAEVKPDVQPKVQPEEKTQRFRQLATLAAVAALALLAACGPAAYVAPPISVTFTPGFTPPTEMTVSQQCGVAATVTNDSKNQGVSWMATCSSANCGGFTPLTAKSASTVPITYTSPAVAPSGGTVTLTATSVTDPTKSVSSSPIAIGSTSSGCTAP